MTTTPRVVAPAAHAAAPTVIAGFGDDATTRSRGADGAGGSAPRAAGEGPIRGPGMAPGPVVGGRVVRRLCGWVAMTSCAALVWTAVAAAHSSVVAISPADGAILDRAPRSLAVAYTDPLLEARSARITVAGAQVAGDPRVDRADRRRLIIPLTDVRPGRHRASWVVVGADGHTLAGETSFSVRPGPLVVAVRRVAAGLRRAAAALEASTPPAPGG